MKLKPRPGRETRLLIGAAMAAAGVIIFTGHIYVASNMISRGITIGNVTLNTGVLLLPFIIGIVCAFIKPRKVWPRYIIGAGLLIMLVSAILSINIRVSAISVVMWLILLVLIFGGIVLMAGSVSIERKKK